MNARRKNGGFRIRRTAQDWVKDPDTWRQQYPLTKGEIYTARLTVDVTPELRRKLRAAAVHADCAMSVIVRRLLEAQLNSAGVPDSPSVPLCKTKDVSEAP